MKATKATKATEQLARWLHKTFALHAQSTRPADGTTPVFEDLTEMTKGNYRAVAARLLTDPPACLREARP